MEDGEISGFEAPTPYPSNLKYSHHPSIEWPDEPSLIETPTNQRITPPPTEDVQDRPVCRLVVDKPFAALGLGRIVLVDGYPEVQFGRDALPPGSSTPKVRIKLMEVSKLHATVYWDTHQKEWAVIDMGSMHGTYLLSSDDPSTTSPQGRGTRLSPSRAASIPRRLCNMDRLTVGDVTFIVHIHQSLPCEECSPRSVGDEVSLFSSERKKLRTQSENGATKAAHHPYPKNPKQALALLKQSLLSQHGSGSKSTADQYIDRSARRRAFFSSSASDSPGVTPRDSTMPVPEYERRNTSDTPQDTEPVSRPATPLPSTNVGHRLLLKQGWQPGESLGLTVGEGVVEPLDAGAMSSIGRRGLGMPRPLSGSSGCRH
ncbi:uncharacterized protein BT62DRAFT_990761 [Guyanagaster necrorhizus]|uniref:Angiogenic factor with G patch and FHA domains 1 n=1 Tax=Guyanagaster necrorhizus TaxID=856835 RepID=A0A9P7W1W3_9AGAR|nr:uncharacterized protein BT62DRAFT_990761 [Guyanagaster necrorhizus MCA 3950]KAG7451112.1 hypothetical protein BT62DRAFT_990761 [Guyanagaster necrorhizus MCA 3950]